MGDTDTDAPEMDAPADEAAQPAPSDNADFKSEESKQRVLADLKREREQRQQLEARLKEIEDAKKSDSEKLADRLTETEQRALKAEQELMRLQVASAKGLTAAQAKRLVGDTIEELEADADEILAAFAPPDTDSTPAPKRRPTELVPGAVPGAEPEPDYDAIADRVRRW
jgi:hypothetical protein